MAASDAPRRETYTVNLGAEATAVDTAVVLVDLSDTTNFAHNDTNWINVLGAWGSVETKADGQYDIWIGVISEVDATNGTAEWFDVWHCECVDNPTDSTSHFDFQRDYTCGGANPDGICCKISSGSMIHITTGQNQAGNVNWQTDTGLLSPAGAAAGATGKPGAGDIVAWIEEAAGTGTCDWNITLVYEAH